MKRITQILLTITVLAFCTVALAQDPPDSPPPAAGEIAPAPEAAPAPAGAVASDAPAVEPAAEKPAEEPAPDAEEPTKEPTFGMLVDAIRGGKWMLAAMIAFFFAVGVFRMFLAPKIDFFKTPTGGYVLSGMMAAAAVIGAATAGGAGMSIDLVLAALAAALGAGKVHDVASKLKTPAPDA